MTFNNIAFLFIAFFILCGSCSTTRGRQQISSYEKSISGLEDYDGDFIIPAYSTYIINDTLNLNGKTLRLQKGVCLKIGEKGVIYNGCIIGNDTSVEGRNVLFSKVLIAGTWIVPDICTSMFGELGTINSLKNIFALTNPSVNNTVTIEEGDYYLSAQKNADICVNINSNTNLILNGTIYLEPNDFPNYSILTVSGDNVRIKGNGSIIGDKCEHTGNTGEWGMCLTIKGKNVCIEGITIKEAWGDCIYVTGKSSDVLIRKCNISKGRRQGISIISANGIRVKDCFITDISGTSPEYAIDVEPNAKDSVDNVLIERVKVRNCKGGISANGRAIGSFVGSVIINKCDFEVLGLPVVIATTIDDFTLEDCIIKQSVGNKLIAFDHVKKLIILRNDCEYSVIDHSRSLFRSQEGNNRKNWPYIISQCDVIKDNGNTGL